MTIRLFHSSKKIPKLLFTTLIEVTISKNCVDHFCEIDHFYKMTLVGFKKIATMNNLTITTLVPVSIIYYTSTRSSMKQSTLN